jgi:hypothetical protein
MAGAHRMTIDDVVRKLPREEHGDVNPDTDRKSEQT